MTEQPHARFHKKRLSSNLPPRLTGANAATESIKYAYRWGPINVYFAEQEFGFVIYAETSRGSVRIRASDKGHNLVVDTFASWPSGDPVDTHSWAEAAPILVEAIEAALVSGESDDG